MQICDFKLARSLPSAGVDELLMRGNRRWMTRHGVNQIKV